MEQTRTYATPPGPTDAGILAGGYSALLAHYPELTPILTFSSDMIEAWVVADKDRNYFYTIHGRVTNTTYDWVGIVDLSTWLTAMATVKHLSPGVEILPAATEAEYLAILQVKLTAGV